MRYLLLLALASCTSSPASDSSAITGTPDQSDRGAANVVVSGTLLNVDGELLPNFPIAILAGHREVNTLVDERWFYLPFLHEAHEERAGLSDEHRATVIASVTDEHPLEFFYTLTDEQGRFACEVGRPMNIALYACDPETDDTAGWDVDVAGGEPPEGLTLRIEPQTIPFDSDLWKSAGRVGGERVKPWLRPTRPRMIEDLKPRLVTGMSRSEVQDLLGSPDMGKGEVLLWRIASLWMDSVWLELTFDEEDRLSEVGYYED